MVSRNTRVALAGTAYSGKTMFLTSLLWQLEEFRDTRFHLRNGVTLRGFRPLSVKKGKTAFPFWQFRSVLAHEYKWPEKTRDVYYYRCELSRSARWRPAGIRCLWRLWRIRRPQRVDFLDLPGERVADAAMVVHDDYGAWSDHVLDHLDQDPVGRQVAAQFRAAAAKPGAGRRGVVLALATCARAAIRVRKPAASRPGEVVLAWRQALVRLIRAGKPFVSPSVFLLDRNGRSARNVGEAELVAERRCGLDDKREFAPLPGEARNGNPKLAKQMRRHYRGYRKELVLPLFRDLMRAHSLVVLVDIPSLLLAGDRRYVDERQVIIDLLAALGDEALHARILPFHAWILRALGLRNALERVAFVAAKADLVSPEDLRSERLLALLRSMNARAAQALPPSVTVQWFVCSACVSTRPGGSPHTLEGQTVPGPDGPTAEYDVSPLPEEWPASWKEGDYRYPEFWPRVPENLMIPPHHSNLDAVFDFTVPS